MTTDLRTTDELILVALDPDSGKLRIDGSSRDARLGGALLIDLVRTGRLRLAGSGKKTKVFSAAAVSKLHAAPDGLLEARQERIKREGDRVGSVISQLGRGALTPIITDLTERRILAEHNRKVLGVVPTTRYDLLRSDLREDVMARLQRALFEDGTPDDRTASLAGLLSSADLLKKVFAGEVSRAQIKAGTKRCRELTSSDQVSPAVKAAVDSTNVAIAAVVAAAAIGAAT